MSLTKYKYRHRSAKTGQFITKKKANKNKNTSVREKVKKRKEQTHKIFELKKKLKPNSKSTGSTVARK